MVERGKFVKKKDSFFCYLEEIFIFAAENAWSSRTGREPFFVGSDWSDWSDESEVLWGFLGFSD